MLCAILLLRKGSKLTMEDGDDVKLAWHLPGTYLPRKTRSVDILRRVSDHDCRRDALSDPHPHMSRITTPTQRASAHSENLITKSELGGPTLSL